MLRVKSVIIEKIGIPKFKILIIFLLFICISGCETDNPKVLIIGDSISAGYTPFVQKALKEKAAIHRIEGNAEHTGTWLKKIHEWLGDEDWDIILFNWGLWDLCYRHPDSNVYVNRDKINGTIAFKIDQYKANLDSLVHIMKELSDARLIFVTTTYVPENEPGRFSEDPIKYNKAAKEVMKSRSVLINDIYKESVTIHKAYGIGNGDVHYTENGNEQLSGLIIEFLEKERGKL